MNFIAQETPQKLRGGYYTPPDIAHFLTRWVLQARPRRLLEPSCGAGVFLRCLAKLPSTLDEVIACELDPVEAAEARRAGTATVHTVDFLGWALDRLVPQFDAVVGNPPFVRYQYLDDAQQRRAAELFARFDLPFTKHTNAWVPFVVASLALLRPGGRLAMVLPSELLHVLHARGLRRFLLQQCSRVLVLDPEDLWFDDTLQGTVLLLAERRSESDGTPGELAIASLPGRAALRAGAAHYWRRADFAAPADLDAKWMAALLTPAERRLLAGCREHPRVRRFADVADVDVGIVTGANGFFLVPDAVVAEYDLAAFAHPMFGRSSHVAGVIYDRRTHASNRRRGLPTNFLWFRGTDLPAGARRYLARGAAEGLPRRYKCRSRTPWYTVPSVHAAPVAMLKRCHHFPRLVRNRAAAFTTDTAYRIVPHGLAPDRLVAGFVNSLTALTAELEGRHYGGGVLELVPSEIERLLLPDVPLPPGHLETLHQMLCGDTAAAAVLQEQDAAALPFMTAVDQNTLHAAWTRLRLRRQRTSAAP